MKVLMVAVAFLAAAAAAGASQTPRPPCLKTAQSQAAMDTCAGLWLKEADTRLDTALASERKRFGASYVNASEAAWVRYEQAECRLEASPNTGGSIYPLIYSTCAEALTDERTTLIEHVLATTPH